MDIKLNRADKNPIVRQIVEQTRTGILSGQIPLGIVLPTVRALASELKVAYLTVYNAYAELQILGLVDSTPRKATRVVKVLPAGLGVAMLGRLPETGPVAGYEALSRSAGLRSMASAVGDPELFRADELISEIEAGRRDSSWNFYYSEAGGSPELLEQITVILGKLGLEANSSSLLTSFGGTHALSMLLDAVCRAGDFVLVQQPGPLGLRELLASKEIIGVPVRSTPIGIDLEHAAYCASQLKAKAFLVNPDFGHSTGISMTKKDREDLIWFALRRGIVLIEDGSMAQLRLEGDQEPTLSQLDPSIVAYFSSFSYTLCPGIRTGFLKAPAAIRSAALVQSKAEHISGIGFLQTSLAKLIARGTYDSHLKRVIPKYRTRRDALIGALKVWMPDHVRWTEPVGGLSTWVTLGGGLRSSEVYLRALSRGVAFSPGSLFIVDSMPESKLRLSYGLLEPEAIREAVRGLAEAMG